MATQSWVLTDTENGIWQDSFSLGPEDIGLDTDANWYVTKRTLRGGLCDGVDMIWVNNGHFAFAILPTRGMGIWRGRCGDLPVGWQSPVRGPVNPAFINLMERGGLGWLNGFDEMIVRCGLDWTGGPGNDIAANNMGEPVEMPNTLHGHIANLPAHRVEVQVIPGDPAQIVILGEVDESALFLPQFRLRTRISTQLGQCGFTIEDEVVNQRAVPAEMELLYHCNFGPPFLEEGAELRLPSRLIAPRDAHAAEEADTSERYAGPAAGYVERCYWYEPLGDANGDSLAMLHNAAGDKAVVVRFNVAQLPCFTQWKNLAAESDGYVTGLEPGTDYPNPKPFERRQGRVAVIPAGGSHRARLDIEVLNSAAKVAAGKAEIAAIQGRQACERCSAPMANLTP